MAYLLWQARRQWGILTVAVLLGTLMFSCQAALPFLTGHAIDSGLTHGFGRDLWWSAAGLLGLGLVSAAASALGHRYDVENWLRASFAASQLVGRRVSHSGHTITATLPTGEVVSAVANDALRIGEIFHTAARFIGSIAAYGIAAFVMLRTSVSLGLIVLLGLPTVAVCVALLVKPLQRRQAAQREASGRLTTLGSDTVSGLRILRGIGGEGVFTARYRAQSQLVRHKGEAVAVTQSWLDALQVLLPGVFVTVLIWYGAHLAVAGEITPGQLVQAYGFAAFLSWPVQQMTYTVQSATRAHIGAGKVLGVLRVVPATGARPGTADAPPAGSPLVDETSGARVTPGLVSALVCMDPDASAAVATRMARFDDDAEAATPVRLGGVLLADLDKQTVRERIVLAEATRSCSPARSRPSSTCTARATPSGCCARSSWPTRATSWTPSRTAWRASCPRRGARCPAGSVSASRWPGRCCSTPRSCCSWSPRPRWTRTPRRASRPGWPTSDAAARRSSSRPRRWCWTTSTRCS